MTAPGPAIACERLVRRFGAFTAVDGVTFDVAAGEVFGLLGANGSGKSTTIRMLTGILPPTSGGVRVDGVDVVADPLAIRDRLGYVPQKVSLYGNLTVAENVLFYGGIYGLARAGIRARELAIAPDLGLERQDRAALARDLPAGVRQRVAILLALLHEPRILFLDEPTAGVDLANRRDLFDLMHRLAAAGMAILVTSHHLDEMERCDRLAFIDHGRLLAAADPDEVKAALDGGRRYAARAAPGEDPAPLAARLADAGFRVEVAGPELPGAVYAIVGGDAERARLDAVLAAAGLAPAHAAPPSLEAVFGRAVGARRRASREEEAREAGAGATAGAVL
jgi:ABC-2 type transport system ATP-binding protein